MGLGRRLDASNIPITAGGVARGRASSAPTVRTSALIIVLGFAGVIALGTLLLMLPVSTASGSSPPFSVALFTATSAVCVTGLVVVDTGSYWSTFGHGAILGMIQLGGIGFGASATLLFWLAGRNISLSDRMHLSALLPGTTANKVARVSLYIVGISLLIQAVGAVVLFAGWVERYPAGTAAFLALFHSISSFCNAGFDIFGSVGLPNTSLAPDRHNPLVVSVVTLLVLIGGLGFPVIFEMVSRIRYRRRYASRQAVLAGKGIRPPLSLHARLVLVSHFGLFVLSVLFFWLIEFDNPATLGGRGAGSQIMDAVTTATQPRTAGYFTISPLNYAPTSLLLMVFLMFVGAGSAGTGGGVKVNTVATLFASVFATVAGRPAPQLFKRALTQESVNKAMAVILIMLAVIAGATFALSLTERGISTEHLLFEVVSAFSTVGLSLDVTPRLSEVGRVIVELLMFVGRLGPLTMVVLLTAREHPPRISYAEEPVLIG